MCERRPSSHVKKKELKPGGEHNVNGINNFEKYAEDDREDIFFGNFEKRQEKKWYKEGKKSSSFFLQAMELRMIQRRKIIQRVLFLRILISNI